MQTTKSTKQRPSPIGRHVCATALIVLFILAPHLLTTSMAQSEDTKNKTPAPEPIYTLQRDSFSLEPKMAYRENAKYTEEARYNTTHGTVALSVVFRSNGSITDVKVVKGLPYGLTESALEAVGKVRFEPGTKDGQPVSVRGILEFTFNLYDLNER